jgi:hypothetical protein
MPKDSESMHLRELIYRVKQELLSAEYQEKDPDPLFAIDEVTLEVHFVVEKQMSGGLSILKVVEFGSELSGQQVQKAIVKMRPILPREQIIGEFLAGDPERAKALKYDSVQGILKGRTDTEETSSPRG